MLLQLIFIVGTTLDVSYGFQGIRSACRQHDRFANRRRRRHASSVSSFANIAWSTASPSYSSHLFAAIKTQPNSSSSSSIINAIHGGRTLSTKQILHPEIYLSPSLDADSPLLQENAIPLFAGLRSLIKSLETIIEAPSTSPSMSPASTSDDKSILHHLDSTTILRIETSISATHSIDPLCWLHAQNKGRIQTIRHKLSSKSDASDDTSSLPVIYFGDAEGQVEAAAIGKASPSYSDSWDPFVGKRIWDNVNGDVVNGGRVNGEERDGFKAARPPMFKEGDLPPGARIYGGSRFDWKYYQDKMQRRSMNEDGDDWDGFGGDRGGYWILPAVELRREVVEMQSSSESSGGTTDHFDSRHAGSRKVTLAVHLHNVLPPSSSLSDDRDNRDNLHRIGWHNAAKHTLAILRELSDQLSPAIPCTTLPPVLTRSESTGKGGEGESGDGDSGYAFERGVTEALRQIKADRSATDNEKDDERQQEQLSASAAVDSIQQRDTKHKLRKVVLARKVDLNLGSSVDGIDVLMKMKFGGHIGHIFYLNPGEEDTKDNGRQDDSIRNREFLGCTPERLFRIKSKDQNRVVSVHFFL